MKLPGEEGINEGYQYEAPPFLRSGVKELFLLRQCIKRAYPAIIRSGIVAKHDQPLPKILD